MLKDQQIASVAGEGVLAKINKCIDVSGKQWGGQKHRQKYLYVMKKELWNLWKRFLGCK